MFTHIISRYEKCVYKKFFSTQFKGITEMICDYTGISENEAQQFLNKYKLENRPIDFMIDSFETYRKLGFTTEEVIENGQLFKYYPKEHEHHYLAMQEGGFSNFSAKLLTRGREIIRRKISTLKKHGLIPKNLNVADSFLSFINNPEFLKRVEVNYSEKMTWSALHFAIAKQFLAWRLQTNEKEIIRLYEIQTGIPNKSFRVMEENISIAEELGFTLHKILKCGYIIRNHPEIPKQTLREFPELAGCDMRYAMRCYPTLIVTPTIKIRKTYEILKEHNIPDDAIKRVMGILQLKPETVRARLNEIQNSPNTEPLLKLPRLLTILLHHTRAKSRMPYLKQLDLRCTNYSILAAKSDDPLKQFIREGKDVNCKHDVVNYLEHILQVEDKKNLVEKILKHPCFLNVPLHDIGKTLKYLIKCGFQSSNIYQVVWILFYPKVKIQTTLHTLKSAHSSLFSSLNQIQKLNLILYTIERDHHFTGHGVFESETVIFKKSM